MKIDGSGQRKTPRGVCFRAHGKRDPFDTSYCVAKRSSDRSSAGLRHDAPFHNHLSAIPAWRRSHLSGLRHGHPAHRYLNGILAEPL